MLGQISHTRVYSAVMMKLSLPQFSMASGLDTLAMQLKKIFFVVITQIGTAFANRTEIVPTFFLIMLIWVSWYVKVEELGSYVENVEIATLYLIIAAH